MYLSRVTYHPATFADRVQLGGGDDYRIHQQLWRLFDAPKDAPRPFLYRDDSAQGAPRFLLLSDTEPHASEPQWQIESKPFAPKLTPGDTLAFALRFNPVVSRRDASGKLQRHDLVMEAKHQLKQQGVPKAEWPSAAELAQQAALAWLLKRAEGSGYRLESEALITESYDQHRLHKQGKKSPIRFSTLDVQGRIEVRDPAALQRAIAQGFGPAKGFGCGLMLIRRT